MLQPTVYNVTTLPRPAAGNTMRVTERGRSALYCCVELLWTAPEIHHPSHLLVPVVAVLLRSAQNPDACNSTQL